MPRLCYGSAEQVNLLCSHLNRKVQFSLFTFHFSVSTFPLILYNVLGIFDRVVAEGVNRHGDKVKLKV